MSKAKYPPSIVYKEDRCAGCGIEINLEVHHIFNSFNRKHSTEDGLTVMLCPDCHRGAINGVHGQNKKLDLELKETAQLKWMEYYGKTEDDFRKRYGRSWL